MLFRSLLLVAFCVSASTAFTVQRGVDDEFCDHCMTTVGDIRKDLSDPKFEAGVTAAWNNVCNSLPLFKSDCIELGEKYIHQAITWLVEQCDPKTVCTAIGLCPSEKSQILQHIFGVKSQLALKRGDNDEFCDHCMTTVGDIRKDVSDPGFEAGVTAAWDNVCNSLPLFKSDCIELGEKYIHQAITWLVEQLDPKTVCTAIGLCPAEIKNFLQHIKAQLALRRSDNDEFCDHCMTTVGDVRTHVSDPKFEAGVEAAWSNVCNSLPVFKDDCIEIGDKYIHEAITWLVEQMDPKTVCTAIGLCPSEIKNLLQHIKLALVRGDNDEFCDHCMTTVGDIRKDVSDPKFEAGVTAAWDNVCNSLPLFKSDCIELGEKYIHQAITWLVEQLDPKTVCTAIGLCPAEKSHVLLRIFGVKSN